MQPPRQQQSKQQKGPSCLWTVVELRFTFELLFRTMTVGCGAADMCVLEVTCMTGSPSGRMMGDASMYAMFVPARRTRKEGNVKKRV